MDNIRTTLRQRLFLVTVLMAAGLTTLGSAHAGDWSVGIGAGTERLSYRAYDRQTALLPIVNYSGERFFVQGPSAGMHLLKTDAQQFNLNVYYLPIDFKPKDSRDWAMQQLDRRRATMMAGVSYHHNANWGTVSAEVSADTLGRSDGILADLSYQYPIQFGLLNLMPGVGVQWYNSKHSQYYYGVSANEAMRSGLNVYRADSGSSPYLSLTSYYNLSQNWQVFFMGRYSRLSVAAKDSPMTERSYSTIFGAGVLYNFNFN